MGGTVPAVFESILQKLAAWLGVAETRAGEALEPRLRFGEPWSQGAAVLVFLAGATLFALLYRREGKASGRAKGFLAALRIGAFALIMLMLGEMVLSVERTGLPYFVVMVDDSASQGVADRYADAKVKEAIASLAPGSSEPARIDLSKALLARNDAEWLSELAEQHKVRLYLVSSGARPLATVERAEEVAEALPKLAAVEAGGAQSKLGSGIRQVLTELRGVAPSAILMLTDGQTTEGESLEEVSALARRKGVPLYFIGLGDPEPARDLELTELLVDEVAFKDDYLPIRAKVVSRGYEGQDLTLQLTESKPGQEDQAKVVQSKPIKAPRDGQPLAVELVHQPKEVGEFVYTLQIVPMERELSAENNRLRKTVAVREEQLNVLIVEGQPRYEFRYLKTFLEREKTIKLGVVLLSADSEYASQDRTALATFPASKEELFEFDVVIIGDIDPSFLSGGQIANLAEFVTEKGGGILFVAGEQFNPLGFKGTPFEDLLPVEMSDARNPATAEAVKGFRPELTAEGRGNPIFRFGDDEISSLRIWGGLPELLWYFDAPRLKPAAVTLAERPPAQGEEKSAPLIAYQFVGAGKAMFHAIDDTWRWRWRVGDRYFGRFWLQSIRFLARTKLLGQRQAEIITDRARYPRSQPVQIRVRFPNPALARGLSAVTVQVDRTGAGSRRVTLNAVPNAPAVFEGALPPSQDGEYEVKLLPPPTLEAGLPSARFVVEPPAGELERTQMNEAELRRVAEETGGKFYTLADCESLLKDLPPPQKVPLDTDPPIPLWNTWPMLILFLLLIGTEWALRKRKQMV